MVLNEEKKNKLAGLIAPRQTTLSGPSRVVAPAQDSPGPVLGDKQKGVVVAIGSEDEDTEMGLVFKRQRVGVVAPSHSATDGHAPSFRDNPLSASSPHELAALEGGGENTPKGGQVPPSPKLPTILQRALKCFQNKEAVEALDGDMLRDRVGQSLGEFLVNSSAFVSQAEANMREELAFQIQIFAKREAALNQELNSLRQLEKETKKLLFDKSQQVLQVEAKILPLRNKVIDLEEKVEEAQAKMAKLEERATQ